MTVVRSRHNQLSWRNVYW